MIRPALLRLIQYAAPNKEEMGLLGLIPDLTTEEQLVIFCTYHDLKKNSHYITNVINKINTTQDANTINEG